ncbi:MAG TPA: thiosulfate oxidation carrier complex protein SoxZ [Burkholderiales bacterium]|nr:thiosulfate oxidation carrier complex protein SoxZ [Burkholderiales bacterium]
MADGIKIRAQLRDDVADIKVLISHPMETGQRKDSQGNLIPLHFIKKVSATLNGKLVLDAQWSQAIARNPFLGFKIRGARAGDKVAVSWSDNQGEANSVETTVTPAN